MTERWQDIDPRDEFERFCNTIAFAMYQQGVALTDAGRAEWLDCNFVSPEELRHIEQLLEQYYNEDRA